MGTPIGDNGFWARVEGVGDFCYSAASDSIQVFDDARFNHVHYWDEDKKTVTWQFLGQAALDMLREAGLPHTVRDFITPQEYQAWENYMVEAEAPDIDSELDRLFYDS